MNKKFKFILCGIALSIIGFSGGFFICKIFIRTDIKATQSLNLASTNSLPQAITPEKKTEEVKKSLPVFSSKNCAKPKKEYEDESYLDVGQDVSLKDISYVPSDLVELPLSMSISKICIRQEVAEALAVMFDAAAKDGYGIKVSSGFRSYTTQKSILAQNIKDGNKNVKIAVAKPGHSEHQLGMAVDLTSSATPNVSATTKFENTKEAGWLEENAYLYGFIESYPEDKQDITGYMHEAWHYRYVGIDAAAEIVKNGETLNQYLKGKKEEENKN